MIRRAVLAIVALTFGISGAAFLRAVPPDQSGLVTAPSRGYLNPVGVAISADGQLAYVALSGVGRVAVVDIKSGRIIEQWTTGRNPRETSWAGDKLLVADDEPCDLVIDLKSRTTSRNNLRTMGQPRSSNLQSVSVPLRNPQENLRLQLITEPDWSQSVGSTRVTHQVFNHTLTSANSVLGFSGGSSNGHFSGALGFAGGNSYFGGQFSGAVGFGGGYGSGRTEVATRIDGLPAGIANPSDMVWSNQLQKILVASSGTDFVVAMNVDSLRKAAIVSKNEEASSMPGFGWSGGFGGFQARQIALTRAQPVAIRTQSAPSRMALSEDGRTLIVSNTLSDSLTVIAIEPKGPRVVKHIALGGPKPDAARRGEQLFNSAKLSFNQRFACSSCHPGGGSDGRVWDTAGEDPGQRVTKSLLGCAETAPYGWHGDSDTLTDRVRKTVTRLHRLMPTKQQTSDLVAYLETLPAPTKQPIPATQLWSATRGKMLFEGKGRCTSCHRDDTMEDGLMHDVGTGGSFNTPSLRGIGKRGNLLHDGRANHIESAVADHNRDEKHGNGGKLSLSELYDLAEYLRLQ